MSRSVLLVTTSSREQTQAQARAVGTRLVQAGFTLGVLPDEADELSLDGASVLEGEDGPASGVELVLALGGDGTFLRAAELARPAGAPLLGVNLGRVGFLAEAEPDEVEEWARCIVDRSYSVEDRLTVDVVVRRNGEVIATEWALNEATVEKVARERMAELVVEVDGRPLSRFGCDGVVCATPTGSTAYAFSAGGPVVWPQVSALLVVPISAHALFSRPLVVGPDSVVAVELLPDSPAAVLGCDGRRTVALPDHARVEVRRGRQPVRLVRLREQPFTDRLVAKFHLPVQGWRGRAR